MSEAAVGSARRSERWAIGALYVSGVVQGVVMVSFAASSAVLRARHGFTDTQYGSIFLPQVVLAATAAIGSGALLRMLDLLVLVLQRDIEITGQAICLARAQFLRHLFLKDHQVDGGRTQHRDDDADE